MIRLSCFPEVQRIVKGICNRHEMWNTLHRQKCKSTIGCAMHTCVHAQLIASFPWTPTRCVAYSHLSSIHSDMHVGLWNYIRLGDLYLSVLPGCYTGIVHTLSPLESLLALESLLGCLLWSLLDSLLGSLLHSLIESLFERLLARATLECCVWESCTLGGVEFSTVSFLAEGKL